MESRGTEGSPLEGRVSDLKLVAHPRAKSKVWKYFGFDTDAFGCILHWKKIYCRICLTQIAYSGNTSNLSYHLEKNHPEEYCELVKSNTEHMREVFASAYSKIKSEPSQPFSLDVVPGKQVAFYENAKHNELNAAVTSFICEGLFPVSVVEEPSFVALLKAADPKFVPPTRLEISVKCIPLRYNHVREVVFKDLVDVVWCGISTDMWKCQAQNRTYITLFSHFLKTGPSNCLTMLIKCLKTFEVPEENTAENITRALYEAFVEWGISPKVYGATTDSLPDVLKACSLLDLSVVMPCFGHAIKKGVVEAFELPRLKIFLGRCRKLVEYFQHSTVAMYLLREKQKQQGLTQCMLRSDRLSSWMSTLAMLQRLKEQQFVIALVLVEDGNNHHLMLEDGEWNIIKGMIDLLQPLQLVADMITSCRYPTISMVKPVLHMLLNTTLKVKDGDLKEVSMVKEIISRVLSTTYQQSSDIDMFLNIATFLDPRYKKLPFLSPLERSQVENRVVEEAKTLLEKAKEEGVKLEDPLHFLEPPTKKQIVDTQTPSSSASNLLAVIFCQSGSSESQQEMHAEVMEELSNYKSQKVLGLNEDPLRWWSDRIALFPNLPKVLQKFWSIPATSVLPARIFSSSGNALSSKRNRLAPAHVNQQIFLYENTRSCFDAEPMEEDEGEWGVEQNQGVGVSNTLIMQVKDV